MDKKYLFNNVVEKYEKYRPQYNDEVYEEIFSYSNLANKDKVVEIGCGTGQATKAFLDFNCDVTALEIGNELAKYTMEKYQNHGNFNVINTPFEEFQGPNNHYDLIYSATAFHWIPPEIGYKRALDLLKQGGSIALFWNRPSISKENKCLESEIKQLYTKYLGELDSERPRISKENLYSQVQNELSHYGFIEVEMKTFHNFRILSGEEYTGLLETYSDHMSLHDSIKTPFYCSIRECIKSYGDKIEIINDIDLHLGRKAINK